MFKIKNIFLMLFIVPTIVLGQVYDMASDNGTTVITCAGDIFDSGGSAGNYSKNESYEVTICPGITGDLIQLDFSFFEAQDPNNGGNCSDYLQVFDGIGTGGSNLSAGALCGTLAALRFVSTDVNGCITLSWTSNNSTNLGGFEAAISCLTPCAYPTASIDLATLVEFCSPLAINNTSPNTVSFNGSTSTDGVYTSPTSHSIDSYIWDWGDGTTTTTSSSSTTHDFPSTGVYTVTLLVNDDNTDIVLDGCASTNSVTRLIKVAQAPDVQLILPIVNCGDCIDLDAVVESQTAAEELPPVTVLITPLPDGAGTPYSNTVDYSGYFPEGAVMSIESLYSISKSE
jgi:hypothetical protein